MKKNTIRLEPPIATAVGTELTGKSYGGLYINGALTARLGNVMSSCSHNNAVVTGAAGVGKTTLVQAVADEITQGHFPRLKDKRIYSINIDSLLKESQTIAAIGERFKNLFTEARCFNLILFIDEGHRLCNTGDANSLGNIVKPYLTDDKLQVILATTKTEYEQFIERDQALKRRFEEISIEEPKKDVTAKIVAKTAAHRYPDIYIDDKAIDSLIETARRYTPGRHDPDRSLAMLDYTVAWLGNNGNAKTIVSEDVYKAEAEKLGLSQIAVSLDLRSRVNALEERLAGMYPAWKISVKRLSMVVKPAMTRCLRQSVTLCTVKLSGADGKLLHDVAEASAKELGFICEGEIVSVKPNDGAEQLIKLFTSNPHRAVLAEVNEGQSNALVSEIVRQGKVCLKGGSEIIFSEAAVFLIDASATGSKVIGFGAAAADSVDAKPESEVASVNFGAPDVEFIDSVYKHFEEKLKNLCKIADIAADIAISDGAKESLLKKFSTERAWSETEAAAEEIVLAIMESRLTDISRGKIFIDLCEGQWTVKD